MDHVFFDKMFDELNKRLDESEEAFDGIAIQVEYMTRRQGKMLKLCEQILKKLPDAAEAQREAGSGSDK